MALAVVPYKESPDDSRHASLLDVRNSMTEASSSIAVTPEQYEEYFDLPNFCAIFRFRCAEIATKFAESVSGDYPIELVASSLSAFVIFFGSNRAKFRNKRLSVSFFLDCFVSSGLRPTLLQILQAEEASQSPCIGPALYLVGLLSLLRCEFAGLFGQPDLIGALVALLLSDEFIVDSDFYNAVCGLLNILVHSTVPSDCIEPLLLHFGRFQEACRNRGMEARVLSKLVLSIVKLGIDPRYYAMLAQALSALLTRDSYSSIAITYYHLIVTEPTFAEPLTRLGFLSRLLELSFDDDDLMDLNAAFMAVRVAFVSLEKLPELEGSVAVAELQNWLFHAIPWDFVRNTLDSMIPWEVVTVIELVRDMAPNSLTALTRVKNETEKDLVVDVFLLFLEDGSFAQKRAVLSLFAKLVNVSVQTRGALYKNDLFQVWTDLLLSDESELMMMTFDLLLELAKPSGEWPKARNKWIEELVASELGQVILDLRAEGTEGVADKARWLTRRIQVHVNRPIEEVDVMAAYTVA
jgi:hypothetical protein